jgi:ribosomal protein S18 acetylase RimI-like enzyme
VGETCTIVAITEGSDARVAEARALLGEYADGLGVDLSFQSFDRELMDFPASYLPPTGALLLALHDEGIAGSVALRTLERGVAEMKRLYVRPAFRGLGVGRHLAVAIIDTARGMGYRSMRLDTLPGMADAQRLYRSLGFREIAPYYQNPIPGTVYLELDLNT